MDENTHPDTDASVPSPDPTSRGEAFNPASFPYPTGDPQTAPLAHQHELIHAVHRVTAVRQDNDAALSFAAILAIWNTRDIDTLLIDEAEEQLQRAIRQLFEPYTPNLQPPAVKRDSWLSLAEVQPLLQAAQQLMQDTERFT